MQVQLFLQQIINGLSLGSIYALIALGYTMVYGIIKLINFAHGEVFMMGAFVSFFVLAYLKVNFYISMLIAMIFCALLGVIIEKIAYRPLRKSTRVAALITAIGVSYLIQNLMVYFIGPEVRSFPSPIVGAPIQVFGIYIQLRQIFVFVISIGLMLILQFLINHTKMGKAMRAVAVDAQAAELMGINVNRVISFCFAIGSGIAGITGVLFGIYYGAIEPTMGTMPGLKAFVAAVVGGIGSIPGAMIGGVLIGVLETLVTALGYSMYKDAAVYALLIMILLVLPQGILGKNKKEKV